MTQFLLAMPALLFSMVAHEFAHGYAAMRQGDDTAFKLGRLTLNPLKHIDPWMSILLPAFIWFGSGGQYVFGGAKPVPVNPRNYRSYRTGDLIVSSAGVVTNLALFPLFVVAVVAIGTVNGVLGADAVLGPLQRMMMWGVWLNLLLAFFNIVPIPPLDGSHILYHLLPPKLGAQYRRLYPYGFTILFLVIFFFPRVIHIFLTPAIWLFKFALGLTEPYMIMPFLF